MCGISVASIAFVYPQRHFLGRFPNPLTKESAYEKS